jgi:dTDP-4-dehydrorhamnose reductase
MLGQEVVDVLRRRGSDVTATRRDHLNIVNDTHVYDAVRGHDVVINCAAWTDVDGAEKNPVRANAVNGEALRWVSQACRDHDARLIHVSTDYVLSGTYGIPVMEDAPLNPVNAYGRSKATGEEWVLSTLPHTGYVVRTAWLYGEYGPNFVDTMARLAEGPDPVRVVDDQWGQPTWARAVAVRLASLGERAVAGEAPGGVYHGTSQGQTTWYGFARAVFEGLGYDPERVIPVTSEEYKRPAVRPTWSVLSHDRWRTAGLSPYLGNWKTMLGGALATSWLNGHKR